MNKSFDLSSLFGGGGSGGTGSSASNVFGAGNGGLNDKTVGLIAVALVAVFAFVLVFKS